MEPDKKIKSNTSGIIELIKKNIETDYEEDYEPQNLNNILNLYKKVYQQESRQKKDSLYIQLKNKIKDKRELMILDWIETYRSKKYNTQSIVTGKKLDIPLKIDIEKIQKVGTRLQKELVPSKIMGVNNIKSVNEKAKLSEVKFGVSSFKIDHQTKNNKMYLFRRKRNGEYKSTPWIVEKTKDHRYVWRGDQQIDKVDVQYLLKFLLIERDDRDSCPSIVINTGSHGDESGLNSHQTGNMQDSDQRIFKQTHQTLNNLLSTQHDFELKITKKTAWEKILVHLVQLGVPCLYPENADHIIDVQCKGAISKIKKEMLHPPNSGILEYDLLFLYDQKPAKLSQQKSLSTNLKKQISKPSANNIVQKKSKQQESKPQINSTNISKPISNQIKQQSKPILQQKVLSTSSIIKNKIQFNNLLIMFKNKVKAMKILFKASQNNFNIKKYFQKCGTQTHTLVICITNKDKIIGAYSPLSHSYNGNEQIQYANGGCVKDKSKASFMFSLTENDKFEQVKNQSEVVFRQKYKDYIQFGSSQFKICDQSNEKEKCQTQINGYGQSYFNNKYQWNIKSFCRLNGNEDKYFKTKEWQVWKIEMEK